jgi:hypothetical protein
MAPKNQTQPSSSVRKRVASVPQSSSGLLGDPLVTQADGDHLVPLTREGVLLQHAADLLHQLGIRNWVL